MDRGNNHIGCLEVSCFKIGAPLEVSAFRLGNPLGVSCFKIGAPLEVGCFVVCSVNRDPYLSVRPDVVWLTPDMISGEFGIYSNVDWRID